MATDLLTGQPLGGQSISGPGPGSGYALNQGRTPPWWARLLAGVPATGEQQADLYRNLYGHDNVVVAPGGDLYLKDPATREFYPARQPGLNAGNVAEAAGTAAPYVATSLALPEVGAGSAGIGLGARVARAGLNAALQGAGGSALRIGAGAALSGGTLPSPDQAVSAIGGDAAGGLVLGAGVHAGLEGVDALRPHNIIAHYLANRYAEGADRAATRGEPPLDRQAAVVGPSGFTPGQETGSKGLLTVEGFLRRNPTTSDIMERLDREQLQAGRRTLTDFMDRLHAGPADPVSVGTATRGAFDTYLDGITDARRAQGRTDFGFLDTLVGRSPVIDTPATRAVIEDEMRRAQTPGSGSAAAAIGRALGTMHDDLGAGPLSGQQFQNLLQQYGDAAAGRGSVFQNIDSASDRRIAGRLSGALQRDLDTAAGNPDIPGDVARALRTARDNYRANTAPLDELRQSAIGHLIGDARLPLAPEDVAARLARQPGTHLAQTLDILGRADPDLAGQVQRSLIERALERAQPAPEAVNNALAGGNPVPDWSPGRLFANLRDSPVWDTMDPATRYQANVIFSGLSRIAKREGEGSPTANLAAVRSMMGTLGGAVTHPVAAMQFLTTLLTSRGLAHAISTPEGRDALTTLTSTNPATERVARAAGWVASAAPAAPPAQATAPDPDYADAAFRDAVGKLGR